MLEAQTERHIQAARKDSLIADEIEHEQERKRASSDENRVFPFYSSVQSGSVRAAMEMLGEWSRLQAPGGTPFTIEITSPGGSVFDGLALFDYVKELQRNGYVVNTYGTGLIASMATVLLQMGDTRILGANSWFMVHELSDFIIGNLSEIEDGAKVARRINEKLNTILLERATVSKRTFKAKSERKDWYMTAEEAVSHGFADELR
jgi:ATP-dependent protease ClpP protease subunit